ncbi:TRAP transporter small permease [Verticiella sediminum]|uniref:TRAP transporter small permease protein n=1 Tax=Verticiella sediminum TaxID=1247510 RepID=A0A556ABU7_9BURK|nr:TRAP transporter small permease [Verticiella sediminum]TSH90365.1 TRAP transporter small permease [Verticiella sediminum]
MALLERLAVASGVLAAIALASIGVLISGQIVGRMFGHQIPSADDFAAWCLAASIFLALPYALLHGAHIRVTLVLQFLPEKAVKPYEIIATLIAIALSAWGAWHAIFFVYESYAYNEISQGMLRVPLWIPQLSMPVGLTLFALMLVRHLVLALRGELPKEIGHE